MQSAQLRDSNRTRLRFERQRRFELANPEYFAAIERRRRLVEVIYAKRHYRGGLCEVKVRGSFGIEEPGEFTHFLDTASEIIGFEGGELRLGLDDCTRVWPSSITLLCSLSQWVELTALPQKEKRNLISSSTPLDSKVEGYLSRCGFYSYVGRQSGASSSASELKLTVKIEREKTRENINHRTMELEQFVQDHCNMDVESFEKFRCKVLPEVFSNITEHGKAHRDQGWWLMAQAHPKHGFVSICLADNGIGFGNSLRTGGQADDLRSKLRSRFNDDGACLNIALEPDISGSVKAPPPKGRFIKKHERGARKGNGLKRMTDCCKELNIGLSILSHKGYIVLDDSGNIIQSGSRESRIFAGTLYHLLIRIRKREN